MEGGGNIMGISLANQHISFFLKFIKPEYEEDFIQGRLYMNTLKYFIDEEKKSGIRGVGDALEASAVFSDVKLRFIEPNTDTVVMEGSAKRINLYSDNRVQSPVFCLYAVDNDVLEFSESDREIIAKPKISKVDLEKLVSDFGDNMIIVNPAPFVERVLAKCKELKIGCKMQKVKYYNFNTNYGDRIDKYEDLENPDICFIKDEYFKNQNEYRILLKDTYSSEAFILDIGDISDITTKFKITDFFSGNFELRFDKNKI